MRRLQPSKERRAKKPCRKARLWYVNATWQKGNYVIEVSPEPAYNGFDSLKVRAISPKAAGRVYLRNNLARRLTILADETDNPCSPTYMEELRPERIRFFAKYAKGATVKILRT